MKFLPSQFAQVEFQQLPHIVAPLPEGFSYRWVLVAAGGAARSVSEEVLLKECTPLNRRAEQLILSIVRDRWQRLTPAAAPPPG